MKNIHKTLTTSTLLFLIVAGLTTGCMQTNNEVKQVVEKPDSVEYFLLRPELEKAYGYSHAVRIGDDLKISGAVSMDDKGVIVAPGDMEQQMKNCYKDLEKILTHYGDWLPYMAFSRSFNLDWFSLLSTWQVSWANAYNMICAEACLSTFRNYRFLTTHKMP